MKRLFCITAFAFVSCTNPASDTPPPASTTKAERPAEPRAAADALSQRCTNREHGFSVSYPDGWHTNDGAVIPACSAFDPKPVQVPPNSEIPFEIAVVFTLHKGSVNDVTRPSQWERVLSTSPVTIGGRQAVRVEVEATGEGLAERGMRSVRYVLDLGDGRALLASTHNTVPDYARNQEILARMIQSISFS